MWKEFSLQSSYKWLDILQKIVNEYNTHYSSIKMKPIQVLEKDIKSLQTNVYKQLKTIDPRKNKLQICDFVRISKHREAFRKVIDLFGRTNRLRVENFVLS